LPTPIAQPPKSCAPAVLLRGSVLRCFAVRHGVAPSAWRRGEPWHPRTPPSSASRSWSMDPEVCQWCFDLQGLLSEGNHSNHEATSGKEPDWHGFLQAIFSLLLESTRRPTFARVPPAVRRFASDHANIFSHFKCGGVVGVREQLGFEWLGQVGILIFAALGSEWWGGVHHSSL